MPKRRNELVVNELVDLSATLQDIIDGVWEQTEELLGLKTENEKLLLENKQLVDENQILKNRVHKMRKISRGHELIAAGESPHRKDENGSVVPHPRTGRQ